MQQHNLFLGPSSFFFFLKQLYKWCNNTESKGGNMNRANRIKCESPTSPLSSCTEFGVEWSSKAMEVLGWDADLPISIRAEEPWTCWWKTLWPLSNDAGIGSPQPPPSSFLFLRKLGISSMCGDSGIFLKVGKIKVGQLHETPTPFLSTSCTLLWKVAVLWEVMEVMNQLAVGAFPCLQHHVA